MKNPILCLTCANAFSAEESNNVCPVCKTASRDSYRRLVRYSELAMRYGYQYRDVYERDLARGPLTRFYSLIDLPPIFQFLGIAALSGIIGNISYDVLKYVVRKIIKNSPNLPHWGGRLLEQLRTDDRALRKMVQYLQDFVDGREYEPHQVSKLCQQEMEATDFSEPIVQARGGQISKEDMLAAIKDRIRRRQEDRRPPLAEDFWEVWSEIKIDVRVRKTGHAGAEKRKPELRKKRKRKRGRH